MCASRGRSCGRTVATGGSTGRDTVRGLPAKDRQWFDLTPERGGSLHLADRLIQLEGTVNFRDAGGYRTADLTKLRRLSVRTVFDLRTESERGAAPDRVPAGTTHVVADVLAGSPGFTTMPTTAGGRFGVSPCAALLRGRRWTRPCPCATSDHSPRF